MKISKAMLELIIREELDEVIREKNLRKEHRGEKCEDKTGKDRRECEKQAEDAIRRRDKNTTKRREQSANDEELDALGRGKIYGSKPPLKTRKDKIKPKDQINPSIGKELTFENKPNKDRFCSSRDDGKGHNIHHDKDGKFTSKKSAKSTSVRKPQNEPCKYGGQFKANPSRFTRIKCGREDRLNPNVKAKFKCKDGSKVSETLTRDGLIDYDTQLYDAGDWFIIRKDAWDDIITQEIMDTIEDIKTEMASNETQIIENNNNDLLQRCERAGYRTFEQFLRSFNSLILSSKGELFKQDKK